MNQKTKYLTIDTHSRASKWYMGYGSVLLRLGGVRSQRRNGYKNMIVEIHLSKEQVKPGFTTYQPQLNNFRALSEIEETTTKNKKTIKPTSAELGNGFCGERTGV